MSLAYQAFLEVFVPGPLHNPVNGPRGHWAQHARWAKQWRERTHLHMFNQWPRTADGKYAWLDSLTPKRIAFLAQTGAKWDDDNLRAGLKPVRDALKDAGIIHDDGPDSGHIFKYAQVVNRKERGVKITIAARTP